MNNFGSDYYDILGVTRSASAGEIKRSYRRLARRFHPDHNPNDAASEAAFKRICEAHDVLSDPDRRRDYDNGGSVVTRPSGHDQQAPPVRATDSQRPSKGLGGLIKSLFGRGPSRRRGTDLNATVSLDFEEAVRGVTRRVVVRRPRPCGRCSGSGGEPGASKARCPMCHGRGQSPTNRCQGCAGTGLRSSLPCQTCAGAGVQLGDETLNVRVPPGVEEGARVRVPGQGNPGVGGGAPGDLYVTTQVRPHAQLRRVGDDVYLRVPLAVWEATLGTEITVPTLDGSTTIKIPPGTQNAQKFRLRGKGVPERNSDTCGDQLVEVFVVIPQHLGTRAQQLMLELREVLASPRATSDNDQQEEDIP